MRRALVPALVLLAGCGGGGGLPAACTSGTGAIAKALAAAPGDVRIGGTTISDCFRRDATGEQIQLVGGSLVAVAQQLGDRTRRDREGAAALRLGYLVGATMRGAKQSGLADELVRRLEQESAGLEGSGAYRRGLRAGLAKG